MLRRRRRLNVRALALAVCAALGTAPVASAAVLSFSGGSVTLTHDPDVAVTTDTKRIKSPSAVPSSAGMPVPPSYHMNNTYVSAPGNTLAVGSFGHITNSSTAGFTMVAGSGLTQTGGGFTGSSQLRMDFDLQWTVNSTFAPATAFVSLPVAYSVGTTSGDFARFVANITWDNMAGTTWQNYVENTYFTTLGSSGVFTFNFNQPLGAAVLNAGTKIRMKGMIGFQANDDDTAGALARNFEVSAAPETFTFVPGQANPDGTYSYGNANNWENERRPGSGQENPGLHRARFLNWNDGPTDVRIVEGEAIHTLDLDSPNPYTFTGGALILNNAALRTGTAQLNVRGVYGAAAHQVDSQLIVGSDLELNVESAAPLTLNGVVSGQNDLRKLGLGGLVLTKSNTLAGDFILERGVVDANAVNALGVGNASVVTGRLNVNAQSISPNAVQIGPDGAAFFTVAPGAGDRYVVAPGGAIGAEDGFNQIFTRENTTLAAGAMVLHSQTGPERFEPEVVQQTTTPTFLYGIAGEGAVPDDVEVGAGAEGSPWRGIGASFGNSFVRGSFIVDGKADLVVAADGHLTVAATLLGTPASSLLKTGRGVAVIEGEKAQVGLLRVAQGGVLVNNDMTAAEIVVEAGGALGGDGKVGKVSYEGGGILSPGNSPGTLSVAALALAKESQLNFDLDKPGGDPSSDLVDVAGDLVLDGTLNIYDGEHFGPGAYPLIHYAGTLTNNGLEVGLAPQFNYFNEFFATGPDPFSPGDYFLTYEIEVVERAAPIGGGTVYLNVKQSPVPEPATISVLSLGTLAALTRRRRR